MNTLRILEKSVLAAAIAGLVAGCSIDPWEMGNDPSWRFPDGGQFDAAPADARPDAQPCTPAVEVCDGTDNNCDGLVDNVDATLLADDADNCGTCGNICNFAFGYGVCVGGECRLGDCFPSHWNNNGDESDGCEYSCPLTNGGVETCDGIDNDCDGEIDDGFDLMNDPENCGVCNRNCAFYKGTGACVQGECQLATCRGGYVDKDGDPDNGCECLMDIVEGAVVCDELDPVTCAGGQVCADVDNDGTSHCADVPADVCDAVDNDCDGDIDEDAPAQLAGLECYTNPAGGCTEDASNPGHYDCAGTCSAGTPVCTGGNILCAGQVPPSVEVCDDVDNDCNGVVDDGYDKQNDPANCGGCGVRCASQLQHAVAGCAAGQCYKISCLPGWTDLDGDVTPGCEYACSITNGGIEACGDGIDNDCNGLVDDVDFSSDPNNCGACGHACVSVKPFGTEALGCLAGVCLFDCLDGYQDLDASKIEGSNGCEYFCTPTDPPDEVCDGTDNDCNGHVDDGFVLNEDLSNCGACGKNCADLVGPNSEATACENGVCRFACLAGFIDLNGDVQSGDATGADGCEYACVPTSPPDEVCDGVDNDCNGLVDDGPNGQEITQTCYTGPAGTAGVGPCRTGVQTCTSNPADPWNACVDEVTPVAEICDGVDNDCDGETDDATSGGPLSQPCYNGPAGTEDVGLCHGGVQTCTNGDWGGCTGEVTPGTEICDAADNDCDGAVDEDFDQTADLLNCGDCGYSCLDHVGANSYAVQCLGGTCQFACRPGSHDLNGDVQSGDAMGADGCEYLCSPTASGETCDGVDNNCDGQVDEGFDLGTNTNHCGACNYSCAAHAAPNQAVTGCSGGVCSYACRTDFYDRDLDPSNGCEYYCVATVPPTEICDRKDNDCNGTIDDGIDINTDVNNCGACGVVCSATVGANSVVSGCVNGVCRYQCQPGYIDRNGDVALGSSGNGCEYHCTPANPGPEVCDGEDNDCDGQIDEGPTGQILTQACYSGPAGTAGVGQCQAGARICTGVGGYGPCQNEVLPGVETCDGVDNDCDGETDEASPGVPLTQACYTGAPVTQGVGECHGGTQTCSGGFYGACAGEVIPTVETCDGKDNDCDSSTDEDFNKQTDLSNCGTCGYRCTAHAGANSYPTSCTTGVCQYVCRPNYYDRNGDVALGSTGNGCEAYCVLSNGGVEKCGDGIDNDCDGQVDEGFDTQTDIDNCGSCGHSCAASAPPNMDATACVAGVCQYACKANYYDYNGSIPGCEYYCVKSVPETEVCDNADNDCDGVIDDGFDKQTNPNHCGACNNACSSKVVPNATATGCAGGVCQFACNPHYYDLNGDLNSASTNGCEYHCNPVAPGAEVCDGEDNDCDGTVDRDAGGSWLTQACYSPGFGATTGCTAPGACTGVCRDGVKTCTGNPLNLWGPCQGELVPSSEVCDSRDNDCDGSTDETFNKQTDINHCGACGNSCWASRPLHTYPTGCVAGVCQYACEPGYADLVAPFLNTPGGTCEYTCPQYPTTAEICDGVDNDCDGIVDEDLTTPPLGFCYQGIDGAVGTPGTAANNPCKGVAPLCVDPDGAGGLPKGWYCQWPTSVEVDPANRNRILGYELLCNGWDGDCDGRPDDAWPLKGTACKDSGVGVCQGSGSMVCNAGGTDITCQITTPGATPGTEECNGLDDDCDGTVDNDTPGHMLPVTIGATTIWVDVYEASRPDATALDGGSNGDRACSEPGRLPWANVSWDEADAACTAQGKRLCLEDEWQEACEGPAMLLYPYGNTYQAQYCNGNDYDPDCTGQDSDGALATGTAYGCGYTGPTRCVSPHGIVDLSGNVMEWTGSLIGTTNYRVRGGAYDSHQNGMTCDFDFISLPPEFRYSTLGFRCCSDVDLTP